MTQNSDENGSPKVKFTQSAIDMVVQARDQEIGSESHGLWMELADSSSDKRQFSMYFRPIAEASSGDFVQSHDGISIVMPGLTADRLTGGPAVFITSAVIEKGLGQVDDEDDFEELKVLPSSPAVTAAASGAPAADLTGDVAQRVVQTLNQQINPSIASHGGRADLVAVEEDTAYLRLSGGCQGCGLAAVTLSQGIEVALKDSVPEIQRVVDVTDHSSGENPYYEASKK